MDAREVALLTLHRCEKQGGWSEGTLKKQIQLAKLDSRDAALATQLCFGVLQQRLLLDFYLKQYSKTPLNRLDNRVLQALRLGLYQLLFLERIPQHAAVDCSVNLTKRYSRNPKAAGMVNGILRNIQRNLNQLPTIPEKPELERLSIQYSHPVWLVKRLVSLLGMEEAEQALIANNTPVPMTAMVNTTKATMEETAQRLIGEGVEVTPHLWLDNALILSKTGNLEELTAFQQGLFYIQDPASRLTAFVSGAKSGDRVLDTCAAPGGKSFALAIQMENQGEILSCDLHPHKKQLIEKGAQRLGLTIIQAVTQDGTEMRADWQKHFDVVLVDAPCSGLGVIRKKPEIRYKEEGELSGLLPIQKTILEYASHYVKEGGVLVYSTCTILPEENEQMVEQFLQKHPDYQRESFVLPQPLGEIAQGQLTFWSHRYGTDGFYVCKLRRRGAHG